MRIPVLALALAALLAGCAPEPVPGSEEACRIEKTASVPLIPPDPPRTALWGVDVLLDGKPAHLMLDSGATGLSIRTEAAARLGARLRGDLRGSATGMGGTVYRRVFEVDRIAVGEQLRESATLAFEITAEQQAASGFDGILGMGVFDRNDIEIDFPARTLNLYRIRFCPQGRPPWTTPFRGFARAETGRHTRSNRPTIELLLNGRPAHALLDTGATHTIVDHLFATAVGAPATPPEGARRVTTRTMSATSSPLWLHRFDSLEIGRSRIADPQLWIGDLGHATDVLVGLNLLARFRLWISNGSDRVYLGMPAAAAGQAAPAPAAPQQAAPQPAAQRR